MAVINVNRILHLGIYLIEIKFLHNFITMLLCSVLFLIVVTFNEIGKITILIIGLYN